VRAPERRRLPVVLTHAEIGRITTRMPRMSALMARMIYGCGLQLRECLLLRITDVDFDRGVLTMRAGKGNKDRQTVLPESLRPDWERHLQNVRRRFERDRLRNLPGMELPNALERKYPSAGREWPRFWAFSGMNLTADPRSGIVRRLARPSEQQSANSRLHLRHRSAAALDRHHRPGRTGVRRLVGRHLTANDTAGNRAGPGAVCCPLPAAGAVGIRHGGTDCRAADGAVRHPLRHMIVNIQIANHASRQQRRRQRQPGNQVSCGQFHFRLRPRPGAVRQKKSRAATA